ncbi:MAG TPA: tetratricopeptide repeat protein [Longimicrobiales bacterium]|nr:tetratricopeptide repeat protein [Longimicrobiales bacterium]
MNGNSRIDVLKQLLDRNPNDARTLFGLANELEKGEQWNDVVEYLGRYLQIAEDEGNAWGRLGHALRMTGRPDEARAAYEKGVQIANAHGHPSMAAEFEEILGEF